MCRQAGVGVAPEQSALRKKRDDCTLARDVLHNEPMISPRLSLWMALLVGAFVLGWTGLASAQTVSLTESSITRRNGFDSSRSSANVLWISRADCLGADGFTFPLTVSSYSSYQLEVWVGGASNDCKETTARSGANPTCWKIWSGVPTSTTFTVDAAVRDIVGQHKPNDTTSGPGSGTVADCTLAAGSVTSPQQVTLYFMFIDPVSATQAGGVAWSTKFDLAGPNAPASVQPGIGDTLIVLNWTQSTDTDIAGYKFYCDPMPGTEDSYSNTNTFEGGVADAAEASVADASDSDATDLDASCDDDAEAGSCPEASTTTDAAVDASDSAVTGLGNCPSTKLLQGVYPDIGMQCGSGTGTSGKVTGLRNGFTYTIAVSAYDGVGNAGPLSNVVCAAPTPIDDFFKLYKEAGGQAGGTFCALPDGPGTPGHLGTAAAIAAIALGAMLRRRGRR